jgi:opacity protein-like surface antigen
MKALKFAIVILFISVQLMAQVSLGLKVSGGGAIPMAPSDFKDNWKLGYGGGVGLTINVLSSFAVEGEADYYNFAMDSDKMLKAYGANVSGVSLSGGNFTVITVMGNLKYFLIPKISPITLYIFGGGGLASMKIDDVKISYMGISQTTSGTTETKPGVQAGAGIQAGVGSVSVFVEAKYVAVFTKDNTSAFAAVKAGLAFGF